MGRLQSGTQQYVVTVGIVLLVGILCYPFSDVIGYKTIALVLLLVVALLPLRYGVGPVLLAASLSALIWNFFFIPPHFTFAIGTAQDVLMFITYFAIALVTSVLTARVRTRERAIRTKERHSSALFSLTRQLTAAKTLDEAADSAIRTLANFFGVDVAMFLSTLEGDIFTAAHPLSMYGVNEKEFSTAAWVYWNERKAGKFTSMFPSAQATYYPITGPRYPLGVIGMKKEMEFSSDQESLLQNFIAQIASTLEREQLNELTKRTVVYAESEKLYKTLFNSISHELRTPIAAIINASEGIRDNKTPEYSEHAYASEIHEAAERLNRLVENLLDMNRLESGQLAPKIDWCDIRDIINTSVKKLHKELSHHTVCISISDDFPLIKLDFGLIEQAVTNLLHNASLYTPERTKIDIGAVKRENKLVLTIRDHGPGFPPDSVPRLFQKFYRVPGTRTGGTGLGLSIVKGFIEAHKGSITASNHPGGGAMFEITIPMTTEGRTTAS